MKKIYSFIFSLFFIFLLCNVVFAVDYPKPVGFVNDFAGLLSVDVKNNLEQVLKQYEKETFIEIAVVTVKSLEELSVEEYTLGLAEKWGVGKKGKDNGIVFLVALTERKIRIEVGYGMEPDLPDSMAGSIIRHYIVPSFKEGRMAEGVVSGTKAILKALGEEPYEARLEERKRLAEEKRIKSQHDRKLFLSIVLIGVLVLLFVASIIFVAHLLIKASRKKKMLKKTCLENEKMLAEGKSNLIKAENDFATIYFELINLCRYNPPTVLNELFRRYQNFFSCITELREKIAYLVEGEKNFRQSLTIRLDVEKVLEESQKMASFLSDIKDVGKRIEDAKSVSPKLEQQILFGLQEIEKKAEHKDVKEETKELLRAARKKYDEVKKFKKEPVDWIALSALFLAITHDLSKISKLADGDVSFAKDAREKGPGLLKSIPKLVKEAEDKVSDSDVSSSTRNLVSDAKKKFNKTAPDVGNSLTWVVAYAIFMAVQSQLNEAIKKAADDIEEEARRRRRKRSASRSSSYGGHSSSYGGSSGSSFGGFGGGSFGGGGASGGW